MDTVIYAVPMCALLQRIHGPERKTIPDRAATIDSPIPVACLVLMLVGVPLGVVSRRGGKSSGFVYHGFAGLLYYFLSYTGIALGRQRQAPAISWRCGWPIFCSLPSAVFLLWQMATGGRVLTAIAGLASRAPKADDRPAKANGRLPDQLA